MKLIIDKMIKNIESYNRPIIIGFPDGNDSRIIEAIKKLEQHKNIETVVISDAYIKNSKDKDKILKIFKIARKDKNTIDQLKEWINIPNYFAMGLLEMGKIDCIVGGATTATSDLLRPSLQIVKSSNKMITSFFWMTKGEESFFLGDSAIVPMPSKDDLVRMTKLITKGIEDIFSIKPYTAMLSFSTNGSGGNKLDTVNNVRGASEQLTKDGYNILGETQFDAAWDQKTRNAKWKKEIKEKPNTYIFPDLNSGNIGYKIMKLTGGYEAIGPIIVGLNKPISDLSRGCNFEEVYNLSLITMNMFINK